MTTELRGQTPLISVVTPFYNTAPYLVECIESVLSQRDVRFEYLLVNNCSTDGSREIACAYAEKDPRIRLIDNRRFVGQVENYNGALEHIDPDSKYVKLVQADDRLLPACLPKMVDTAEQDRGIGIVSSQYLMGHEVCGLDFPVQASRISGRKVCRDMLLSGRFYLGSPTTVLYRADIVRSRRPFYALGRLHEDTEAAYEILLEYDLGFVHDVLSFMRVERASLTGATRRFGGDILDYVINVERYGNSVLSEIEFRELRSRQWALYGDFLGTAVLQRREKAFWDYHRRGLATIGRQLRRRDLARNAWRHAIYVTHQPLRTAMKRLARGVLVTVDRGAARDRLRAGDWVEVRSKQEILRTLDGNGRLDGLPFMPQMFHFCGTRLRVIKRAHKTCDTTNGTGGRRMRRAVHIENLRCDGEAYAGCGAACLIFWKEAWLKRVASEPEHADEPSASGAAGCTEETVIAGTRAVGWTDADPRYVCQATQLLDATTERSSGDLRQYLEDYESGNVGIGEALGVIATVAWRTLTDAIRSRRDGRTTDKRPFDCVEANQRGIIVPRRHKVSADEQCVSKAVSAFRSGDFVRVKPDATVPSSTHVSDRNSNQDCAPQNLRHGSAAHAVRACVEQIIDEQTGRPIPVRPRAVILDGVWCEGRYGNDRMFCPRSIVPFFRELCVEPVLDDDRDPRPPR